MGAAAPSLWRMTPTPAPGLRDPAHRVAPLAPVLWGFSAAVPLVVLLGLALVG